MVRFGRLPPSQLEIIRNRIEERERSSLSDLEQLFRELIQLRETLKRGETITEIEQLSKESDLDLVCEALYEVGWAIVSRPDSEHYAMAAKALVVAEYLDEDCGIVETGALSLCQYLLTAKPLATTLSSSDGNHGLTVPLDC